PFLPDLAEFEWAKVLVTDSPVESKPTDTIAFTSRETLSNFRPRVNEVLLVRQFDYAVHEIVRQLHNSCCQVPEASPDETILAVYRELKGQETRVCQLSPAGAGLIARAQKGTCSYLELVESEGEKLGQADTNPFLVMLELLDSLRQLGILVGSEPIARE